MNINVQCNNVKGSREKRMQIKDNTQCVIKEENQRTWRKNLSIALQAGNDPLVNKLDYKNTQRPSKLKLPNILKSSKLQIPWDIMKYYLH